MRRNDELRWGEVCLLTYFTEAPHERDNKKGGRENQGLRKQWRRKAEGLVWWRRGREEDPMAVGVVRWQATRATRQRSSGEGRNVSG